MTDTILSALETILTDLRYILKTRYNTSRALIIGINKYKEAPPLSYAVSDALGVRQELIDILKFKPENIVCLQDEAATKAEILKSYLRLSRDDIEVDDRIIVFFAGHGDTRRGNRGEVGYLVPYDAIMDDLSTFIRWNDLTRDSELIRAKHMLFIMDACYGGLALNRSLHAGSARFLKNMMLRFSRQVLTAGKADEEVADAGGPLPDHSIFTGHLLEGIRGKAVNEAGVLTATALMAYVYSQVSSDAHSNQTPHYGHFEGDGDFLLLAPQLDHEDGMTDRDIDSLLIVPYPDEPSRIATTDEKIKKIKSLLASDSSSIELHDVVVDEIRHLISRSGTGNFPTNGESGMAEVISRVSRYEDSVSDLALMASCISYWGRAVHNSLFQKIFSRATDNIEMSGGMSNLLAMRVYPLVIAAYCAGVAAVEGNRYDSLATMLYTTIGTVEYGTQAELVVDLLSKGIMEMSQNNIFKQLPGHEQNRVPMSEHLYKDLQPKLDDILFIGRSYERSFDDFEVVLALACADRRLQRSEHVWGPIGRFGWKAYGGSDNPLERVIAQATAQGFNWPPLKAGMFGGDKERFDHVATKYRELVGSLNWH
jgi:hypothetical protein